MTLENIIEAQKKERYRCFVICGAGFTGKTMLAKKVILHTNGLYFDLLENLKNNEALSKDIDNIGPEQLFKMIDNEDQEFIIADHLDIVFALWTKTKQREFLRRIDIKSNGACIMIILHNYELLGEKGIMKDNTHGMHRIINIAEISH